MRRRNPYDVLDLSPIATYEEARAAYRRLAAIFHPDRFIAARDDVRAEAEKQMRYVNEAWAELSERLKADEVDDRLERERQARRWIDEASEATAGPRHEEFKAAANDDFASRARHARTKQRTWARSNAASEQRDRAAQQAEDARRAEFIREAQERLAEEERAAAERRTADAS
jgi:curved DNA-binding protein CbpA